MGMVDLGLSGKTQYIASLIQTTWGFRVERKSPDSDEQDRNKKPRAPMATTPTTYSRPRRI